MHPRRFAAGLALALSAVALSAAPAHAQGKGRDKHYAVSSDRAVTVTRNVLVRQGYDVVRIERVGATQVVYYRAGNRGRGRGKGPVEKMVIRTVERRIVFEDTPPAIMVDIDVNLKL
jgi:lipopolysaccharide export system protein LptA